MQGTVPTCVGSLSNLTSIDYTYAGTLSGTLPRGLCDLTRLEKLQFQYTGGLSGTSSVEHLYFWNTRETQALVPPEQQTFPSPTLNQGVSLTAWASTSTS